jgi:hypothetical protein
MSRDPDKKPRSLVDFLIDFAMLIAALKILGICPL